MNQILRSFFLLAILAATKISTVTAQVNIIQNDTAVCSGVTLTFNATNPATGIATTPFARTDSFSSVINIGFPFTFYGNTYTQCVISSNGFISFNTALANTASPFVGFTTSPGAAVPIPGNPTVLNTVMGNYGHYITGGGGITYSATGAAPNRRFVVTFCSVPFFDCPATITSFQMVLFETSNIIELNTTFKGICPTNSSVVPTIQGVQNATGTFADGVPGRNYPNPWTASRDTRRFTPVTATSYTITSVPYNNITIAGNSNFTWYTLPNNILGNSSSITVNPMVSTTYYVRQVGCSDTTRDSIRVTVATGQAITSITPTNPISCGGANGTLALQGLTPNVNYSVVYKRNGIAQPAIILQANNAGVVTIPNLTAGTYTDVAVVVGNCPPSASAGPYVLANLPIPVDFTTSLGPSCGGIDTIFFTNITPPAGNVTFTWDFGDGGTSTLRNPTHVYTAQNQYSVLLTANNGFCKDSLRKTVDTRHPLDALFTVDFDSACIGQVLNFTDASTFSVGTASPTYSWDFGDTTTGTGNAPIHSYSNPGVYHVRLVITDFVPCKDTFYKDIFISNTSSVTFASVDSNLCEGQSTTFVATFTGVRPATYVWTISDGTTFTDQNPIIHSFDSAGIYTIKIAADYTFCPDTFYMVDVPVHPYPMVNIGPDTSLCPGSQIFVLADRAPTNGIAQYIWNTGIKTPTLQINKDGTYSVTKTVDGCSVSDSITITKNCYIDIPNVFSPNGDGINDRFLPRQVLSKGLAAYKMSIYNRWGQMVFESLSNEGQGWDGTFNDKPQPQGAYVYMITATFIDKRTEKYKGSVTLIR